MRTDEETVVVGEYAKTLLSSDLFCGLYKEYTDTLLSNIVNSDPHETKVREYEYAKIRAISEFVNGLADLAKAAAQIVEKNNKPVNNSVEADEGVFDVED